MLGTQLKLARLWQLADPCQQLTAALARDAMPWQVGRSLLEHIVPATEGNHDELPPVQTLPLEQQQIVQQLQGILECLFQEPQEEAALAHVSSIVGEEAFDQLELDAEEEHNLQLKQRECQAAHAEELAKYQEQQQQQQQRRRQADVQQKHSVGAAGGVELAAQKATGQLGDLQPSIAVAGGAAHEAPGDRKRTREASAGGTQAPAAAGLAAAADGNDTATVAPAAEDEVAPSWIGVRDPLLLSNGSLGAAGESGSHQRPQQQRQQRGDEAAFKGAVEGSRRSRTLPSGGYRISEALQELSRDQQQAFVVEVAALLRKAIDEQRVRFSHRHLASFLKTCREEHQNVGRLLGSFNSAIAFFMSFREVFEIRVILRKGGTRAWDPVYWEAGTDSPRADSRSRQQQLIVGLVQQAGEYSLWGNEHGKRLGLEFRERVVEVLKQRGLWEQKGEEKQLPMGDPGMLSLEELIGMVPEDMEHYTQVRWLLTKAAASLCTWIW